MYMSVTIVAVFITMALLIQTTLQKALLHETCQQGINCHLPECFCNTTTHHLNTKDIPQIIYFAFDDALTNSVGEHYRDLFTENRRNPNGCPISMSLYIQHEFTDYSLVREFYERGMEIGVHGVSHSNVVTRRALQREAKTQKLNLSRLGKVPLREIVGWRSPFLRTAGDDQPEVLRKLGYTYDISLTSDRRSMDGNRPWPYTLDYGYPHQCMIPPCPEVNVSHPGFWEVPVNNLMDHVQEHPCVFVDGCINRPGNAQEAFDYLWTNFQSYYRTNKAPFGLNMHAAWFWTPLNKKAMDRFIEEVLRLPDRDVYIVTVKQMLDWMRRPTPVTNLWSLPSWNTCGNNAHLHKNNAIDKSHILLNSGDYKTVDEEQYNPIDKGLSSYVPGKVPFGPLPSARVRKLDGVSGVARTINRLAASGPTRYGTSGTRSIARTSIEPGRAGSIQLKSSRRQIRGKIVREGRGIRTYEEPPRMPGFIGKSRYTVVISEQKQTPPGRNNIRVGSGYFRSTKTDNDQSKAPMKRRYRANIGRINGRSDVNTRMGQHHNRMYHNRDVEHLSINARVPFVVGIGYVKSTGTTNGSSPMQIARIRSNANRSGIYSIIPSAKSRATAKASNVRRHTPSKEQGQQPTERFENRKNTVEIMYESNQDPQTASHYTSVPEGTWIFGPRQHRTEVKRIMDRLGFFPVKSVDLRDGVSPRKGRHVFQSSRSTQNDNEHNDIRGSEYTNTQTGPGGGSGRPLPLDYHRSVNFTIINEIPGSMDQVYDDRSIIRGRDPFTYKIIPETSKQLKPHSPNQSHTGLTLRGKAHFNRKRPSIRQTKQTQNNGLRISYTERPMPRLIGGQYRKYNENFNSIRYKGTHRRTLFPSYLRLAETIKDSPKVFVAEGTVYQSKYQAATKNSNSHVMGTVPPKEKLSLRIPNQDSRNAKYNIGNARRQRNEVGRLIIIGNSLVRKPLKSQTNKRQRSVELIERQYHGRAEPQPIGDEVYGQRKTARMERFKMERRGIGQNGDRQTNLVHKDRKSRGSRITIMRPIPIHNKRTTKLLKNATYTSIHEADMPRYAFHQHTRLSEFRVNSTRGRSYITRRLNRRRKRNAVEHHGTRIVGDTIMPRATRSLRRRDESYGIAKPMVPLITQYNSRCSQETCLLPSCFCRTTAPPGGLPVKQTPQIVLLTFDGSVSWSTFPLYKELFRSSRKNPNGCPVSGTFYVPAQGNSKARLTKLTNMGMEIAVKGHSSNISEEVNHLQEVLPLTSIWGWKSDQKPLSGKEFDSIDGRMMMYDSSLNLPLKGSFRNRPWPYTLDNGWQDCDGPGCPTTIQKGLWEVPVTPVLDHKGSYKCVYADGCYWNPPTAEATYNFFWNNFQQHYNHNRAPIGFAFRQAWFHTAFRHNRIGLEKFVDKLTTLGDTYIISIGRLLEWMKQPTGLGQVATFPPWQC